MAYYEAYEQLEDQSFWECPYCSSDHTEYDRFWGFWRCHSCNTQWPDNDFRDETNDLQEGEQLMLKDRTDSDVSIDALQNQPPNVSRVEERIFEYFQTLPEDRRRAVLDQLASQNDLLNTPKE